jgi:hypothetical protein
MHQPKIKIIEICLTLKTLDSAVGDMLFANVLVILLILNLVIDSHGG